MSVMDESLFDGSVYESGNNNNNKYNNNNNDTDHCFSLSR